MTDPGNLVDVSLKRSSIRLITIATLALLLMFPAASGASRTMGHHPVHELDAIEAYTETFPRSMSTDSERGFSSEFEPGERPDGADTSDETLAELHRIFPPDDRVRVTPTDEFPASAVALIEKRIGNVLYSTCTGTFVGPNVVLTAGHCLYTHQTGWGTSVAVVPGKDGDAEPFGFGWAVNGWVPEQWFLTEHPAWDWGLILLPDHSLGEAVGWFEIGVLTTESLSDPDFHPTMIGYPGDKPYGTMWQTSEPAFFDVFPNFLANHLDSVPGQSGSAVWRGSDRVVVGIQVLSTEIANLASRIDMELMSDILSGCATMGCQISYFVEHELSPPVPLPPPVGSGPVFATGERAASAGLAFNGVWGRTDYPVGTGMVNRTWIWGPQPFSAPLEEHYQEGPGGIRVVRYYDKSRMEENAYRAGPPWHVTNGLLVIELITGQLQFGDGLFDQREPAGVQVAGDEHPDSPTYAMLDALRAAAAIPEGTLLIQRLLPDGSVVDDPSLVERGVAAGPYVPETQHGVAAVFWTFMNASGLIFHDGGVQQGNIFENPFVATGYPVTEPYWVTVPVGGVQQDVLLQCFQRRCLTFTPGNPPGWQVEAGNVGQHYYRWRYGDAPPFP